MSSSAIGDALVAQVPALLLSIAAASIVTRVSSPHDLSGQIASQFAHAGAWAPVAAISRSARASSGMRPGAAFPPPPSPG
jgi:flagellar biosynthesis component FlhA